MSFQVGLACYADLPAAGSAACSLFSPVTNISNGGASVSSISCDSSGASGELYLKVATAPIGGGTTTFSYVYMPPTFQRCMYPDFVEAGILIFVSVLSVWALTYGGMQIYKMLHWSRGDL